MPIDYRLDATTGLVVTEVSGTISARDVIRHIEALNGEHALGFAELIDARRAQSPTLSPEDIWQMAAAAAQLKDQVRFGPRAIVVGDSFSFALSRMFGIVVNAFLSAKTFHDLAQAESWLSQAAR